MFSPKYYEDPFADDENDICYAEIVSNGGGDDGGASAGGEVLGTSAPMPPSITSFTSAYRRPSEVSRGGCAASTEIPLSAVNPTPRGNGQIDDDEYETYIELLRAELEEANKENNRLTTAQTKLESRVRSLTFEKENAEWQLQQEKERSAALGNRVETLEKEVEELMRRPTLPRAPTFSRGDSVESSALYAAAAPAAVSATPEASRSSAPHSFRRDPNATPHHFMGEESPLPPVRSIDMSGGYRVADPVQHSQRSYASSHGAYDRENESLSMAPYTSAQGGHWGGTGGHMPAQSGMPATRSQMRAVAAQEAAVQQQQSRQEREAAVQGLEAQLLEHSQTRDELTKQLERIERMRTRTVADRKKKAAIERGLEEEEKIIGHLRLELRSRSALLRWLPSAAAEAGLKTPLEPAAVHHHRRAQARVVFHRFFAVRPTRPSAK